MKARKSSYQDGGKQKVYAKAPRVGSTKDNSTHLMSYTSAEGKHYAYPTLFQDKDLSWQKKSDKDNWAAFEEAKKRGELFEFQTEKEAADFAAGSWKKRDIPKGVMASNLSKKKG